MLSLVIHPRTVGSQTYATQVTISFTEFIAVPHRPIRLPTGGTRPAFSVYDFKNIPTVKFCHQEIHNLFLAMYRYGISTIQIDNTMKPFCAGGKGHRRYYNISIIRY